MQFRILISKSAVLAALAVLLVAVSGPPSHASGLQCGDVVATSVVLEADLVCPTDFTGSALTISSNNVELDLGGHAIVMPASIEAYLPAVKILGRNNITVRNGRIGGWPWINIGIDGGRNVVIRDLAMGGENRVWVSRSRNVLIEHNVIRAEGHGVNLVESHGNDIVQNSIRAVDQKGVSLRASDINRVQGNSVSTGDVGVQVFSGARNLVEDNVILTAGQGILVQSGDRNVIRSNEMSGGASHGLLVSEGASRTLLHSNTSFGHSAEGIRVPSTSTTVTGNTANENTEWGIWAVAGVVDGGGNRASGNREGQCHNIVCS